MNFIGLFLSTFFLLSILIVANYLPFSKEAKRNFVHIGVSNWFFIAYGFFDQVLFAIFVPCCFVIVNFFLHQRNSFLERDKKDFGTVYYAISCFLMTLFSYLFQKSYLLGVGLLVMGYGDGLANVVGRHVPIKTYTVFGHKKSVMGTFTMFLVSFFIVFGFGYLFSTTSFLLSLLIACLVTILENITPCKMDNLSVPLTAFFLFWAFF